MIDAPNPTPEMVIERKLIECGLQSGSFRVQYEDYLQSIEIVIPARAGVSANQIACIHAASGTNIVTFEDDALSQEYYSFLSALYRPQMLAEATQGIKKLGLLEGFPRRAEFGSVEEYARAIERHCGVKPGAGLKVDGEAIVHVPPAEGGLNPMGNAGSRLMTCTIYAIATGDFEKFMIIGNAAIADVEEDK